MEAAYYQDQLSRVDRYISKNFELIKSAAQKDVIDHHLLQKKGLLVSVCAKIVRENLDAESSVMEWGRFLSFPFFFFLTSLIIGISSLFIKDVFGIFTFLGILGILGYFLWIIFLMQGGFNYIFKMLIIFDLLRRYKIKY